MKNNGVNKNLCTVFLTECLLHHYLFTKKEGIYIYIYIYVQVQKQSRVLHKKANNRK